MDCRSSPGNFSVCICTHLRVLVAAMHSFAFKAKVNTIMHTANVFAYVLAHIQTCENTRKNVLYAYVYTKMRYEFDSFNATKA